MSRPRTPIGERGTINIVELDATKHALPRELDATGKPKPWKVKADEGRTFRARTYYRNDLGQRRQIERYGSTPSRAESALLKALRDVGAATSKDLTADSSIAQLAERFLEAKANDEVAPRTLQSYRERVKLHILNPTSGIGSLSLREATTERLQAFVNQFVKGDEGRGIAKEIRKLIGNMFSFAVRVGAIPVNPARELRSPRSVKSNATTAYTSAEISQILATLRSDKLAQQYDLFDVIAFLAGTGARIGEVLAMHWDDVDLDAGTVTIHANLVRVAGQGLIRQPHTKTRDRRVLPLPEPLLAILMQRRVTDRPNLFGAVFPSGTGTYLDPRNFNTRWKSACDRLQLPYRSTHAFRKSVATTIDLAGLGARAAAEQLGHKDPAMTMAVYMSKETGDARAAQELAKHFPNTSQSTE